MNMRALGDLFDNDDDHNDSYYKIHNEDARALESDDSMISYGGSEGDTGVFSMSRPKSSRNRVAAFFDELFTIRNSALTLLTFLFMALMSSELILRKVNATLYFSNYRSLLNILLTVTATLVFFLVLIYMVWNGHVKHYYTRGMLRWFCLIAVFDSVAMYMIILSSNHVSAPLQALLAQGVVPITMLGSMKV